MRKVFTILAATLFAGAAVAETENVAVQHQYYLVKFH